MLISKQVKILGLIGIFAYLEAASINDTTTYSHVLSKVSTLIEDYMAKKIKKSSTRLTVM